MFSLFTHNRNLPLVEWSFDSFFIVVLTYKYKAYNEIHIVQLLPLVWNKKKHSTLTLKLLYQIFPGLVVRMLFFPAKNSFPSGSQKHLKEILLLWVGDICRHFCWSGQLGKGGIQKRACRGDSSGVLWGLAILGEDPCWLPDFYRTAGAQKAFLKE